MPLGPGVFSAGTLLCQRIYFVVSLVFPIVHLHVSLAGFVFGVDHGMGLRLWLDAGSSVAKPLKIGAWTCSTQSYSNMCDSSFFAALVREGSATGTLVGKGQG